jgi:hypothetical protein
MIGIGFIIMLAALLLAFISLVLCILVDPDLMLVDLFNAASLILGVIGESIIFIGLIILIL